MKPPNPYIPPPRINNSWFFVGLTTSFPNITASSSTSLSDNLPCRGSIAAAACKVFQAPTSSCEAIEIYLDDTVPADLKDQVVVFRYQDQFHAVDHRCPHSSYPLSKGTPFDIEDFGIRLSAGIRCPKHEWSFDLVRGNGDRGNYRLGIWEVQVRSSDGLEIGSGGEDGEGEEGGGVWVRRKQRIG